MTGPTTGPMIGPTPGPTTGYDARRGWGLLAPALIWTLAFFAAPLVWMACMSLWRRTAQGIARDWSLDNYTAFFTKPAYFAGLVNSVEITAIVVVASVLLAYPLAAIIAFRVPARWRRLALLLAVLPFWTSYVVRSYAWLLVLSKGGIVNDALMASGLIDAPVAIANTRAGTVIGFVHFFVMLMTLTIYADLARLPRSYIRAAADLGAGPVRIFRHVILPLTLPGVCIGAFLTLVVCIGDYITPQILGGNAELTLPQLIMMQIGRRADFPAAAAMALILMAVIALAYLALARWMKAQRT